MQFSEDSNNAHYQIKAYDQESVTINNKKHTSPFYLSAQTLKPLTITSIHELTDNQLNNIKSDLIDVLIIGTGSISLPAPKTLQATLAKLQLGFETMNTPAACRSYSALQAEGRRVAALIFPKG
jgi:uncharacterized protein